jgi:hypothetical protein
VYRCVPGSSRNSTTRPVASAGPPKRTSGAIPTPR